MKKLLALFVAVIALYSSSFAQKKSGFRSVFVEESENPRNVEKAVPDHTHHAEK